MVAYSETGLCASATYYYRVRATNALGDSANTPTPPTVVSATTLGTVPTAPSGLTANVGLFEPDQPGLAGQLQQRDRIQD